MAPFFIPGWRNGNAAGFDPAVTGPNPVPGAFSLMIGIPVMVL